MATGRRSSQKYNPLSNHQDIQPLKGALVAPFPCLLTILQRPHKLQQAVWDPIRREFFI